MTKQKSTKRALFSSVLVMLLCFAMLLGTTFAWFTDSVTSGKNQIVAGNLDISLEYSKDMDKWTDVDNATDLFTGNLWEPGHTEVVYLKLTNEGSLAVKYQLSMNIISETLATNVNGNKFKLSEYLKFGLVDVSDTFEGRAAAIEAVETEAAPLANHIVTGNMKAQDDASAIRTMALVVYMPETVGNEANYRGDVVPTIDLGINLVATQDTVEADSFGIDYDANAVYADKTYNNVTNLAETLEAIESAEDEIVLINLTGNVTWATEASHGSSPLISANNENVKQVIINGNGYTLTATGKGVGPIRAANGATLTFNNLVVVDESESYAEGSWEFGYLEFAGNLEFNNVTFKNAITIQQEDTPTPDVGASFVNCSFNSNAENEYDVWVSDGTVTFTGCTFAGYRGLKMHEAYGSDVFEVVVDDCTFDSLVKKPGVAIGDLDADTVVTIKNSDFINCQPGDQDKYIYESDTDVSTFKFTLENNQVVNYTNAIGIGTAEQLFAFAKEVNENGNSYSGTLVKLTADIDLENKEWTPIGQTGTSYGAITYFQGIFDGQGHTISNLSITKTDAGANYAAGLFGFIDAADATIKNVNVKGATVKGHHWTGVIAGYITGKISGCTVTDATVNCTHANDDACGDKAGVIVGYVNSGTVTGNTVKDSTVTAGRDAGQVAGAAKTTQVYGNTIYNVTVSAVGNCTGAHINNAEIGRIL